MRSHIALAARPAAVSMLLALALPACRALGPDSGDSVRPIESKILFSISEGYTRVEGPEEPVILLRMATAIEYGCYNYSVLACILRRPRAIDVLLEGIGEPGICLTAMGPARFEKQIALEEGTYALRFAYGRRTDAYELAITPTAIRVVGDGSDLTAPEHRLAWRFPRRSFAYLCGTTTETSWICADFAESLLAIPTVREYWFPESGVIPYPQGPMGTYYEGPRRYFLYDDEAAYAAAGACLERFTRDVIRDQQGIILWLVNWRNEQHRSWMFGD